MPDHLLRFDKLIRELKSSGATVEESDAVCHLLLTLPASFDSVVTAIETLPDGVTMDFVKKRLLDVDMKRRNSDVTEGASGDGVAMASKHQKRKVKCYQCGKVGHKKVDCRENLKPKVKFQYQNRSDSEMKSQKANVGAEEEAKHSEIAFLTAVPEDLVCVGWLLDSGATDHMVNDSSYFSSMKKLDPPVHIVVANGQKLTAHYCGDVSVYSIVGDTVKNYLTKNVLYIPGLNCNLLSVKRITRSGLQVCFAGDKVNILKNGSVIAVGCVKDKLYKMDIYCKRSEMGSALVSGKVSRNAVLWHQRFGHVGCDSLRELVKREMVRGIPLTDFDSEMVVCEPCLSGKVAKLPYAPVINKRSSRPLELIHSDVCGPITPCTWNGKRFFVSFIDDYSHFAVIYLLASKDEVVGRFREYEALVSAHFGTKIARLRSDNGGEYANDEMRMFCRKKGIVMDFTVPYTPQQNGVSERFNRTVMERARALLAESGLGKEMWGEATLTATYLMNRCPTSAVPKNSTPYEIWYNRKPDVAKLRIFGCAAYLHIPKELRSKLDPKCKKMYLVGYTVNGYRLWDHEKKKLVIGRDVVFDEETMYREHESDNSVSAPKVIELEMDRQSVSDSEPVNPEEVESVPETEDPETEEEEEQQDADVRRSGRTRRQPVWFDCYEMCETAMSAENFVEEIPDTVDELRKRNDWPKWKTAITDEMESLTSNKTWVLTSLPPGKNLSDSKWIFKIKPQDVGGTEIYKARLVARGFSQRKGFDYDSTYAPVASLTTLRILLAIANQEGMHLHQHDVKTAFLNGMLDQETYMRLPKEFGAGDLVAKLEKSIYGPLFCASRDVTIVESPKSLYSSSRFR